MHDDPQNDSAASSTSRSGHTRQPWLSSGMHGQWWSPSPPARGRVVDQDVRPQTPPAPHPSRVASPFFDEHEDSPYVDQGPSFKAWLRNIPRDGSGRVRWWALATRFANSTPAAFLVIVLILMVTALVVSHLPWIHFGDPGAGQEKTHLAATAIPTHRPLPTSTPTPTQTELDGVITIQNLDSDATFEGDVQVLADNGRLFCRNAPLPNSTWHIVLAGGATTTVPCIIPVSAPSTLPTHTFTAVETGQNGKGRVLLDNLTPFQGTAYFPTPASK